MMGRELLTLALVTAAVLTLGHMVAGLILAWATKGRHIARSKREADLHVPPNRRPDRRDS